MYRKGCLCNLPSYNYMMLQRQNSEILTFYWTINIVEWAVLEPVLEKNFKKVFMVWSIIDQVII